MASLDATNEARKDGSTDQENRNSSCDFCSKIVSVFSTPYNESSKVDLGAFSSAITTGCPHSRSLRNITFKYLNDGTEHRCEQGNLQVLSPLFSDLVALNKICPCETETGLTSFYSTAGHCELVDLQNETGSNGETRLINNRWIDMSLIQSWYDRCQREHGKDCDNYVVEGLGNYQPDWLIDTVRGCLSPYTPGEPSRRYLTLSYVWGQAPSFQALRCNIGQLQTSGVLLSGPIARQIPKTIRDAIQITRRLGETFLWVDSLCIIQDDDATRGRILRQMHLIYLSSTLTIIAEHGQNSRQGIRGIKGLSKRRLHQQTLFDLSDDVGKVLVFKTSKDRRNTRVMDNPHAYHMRMWTYQEYLLSKRQLIFGSGPVGWICNKARWLEDEQSYPEGTQPDQPLKNYMADTVVSRVPSLLDLGYIVSLFSGRAITHQSDVLFSFSGIQSMFQEQKFPDGLLYGLPEFYFDIALTWIPNRSGVTRRRLSNEPNKEHLLLDKLPTWSWMGWQGGVDFFPDNEFESRGPRWAEAFGFAAPVTEWFALDSPKSETRRAIKSRWHGFRTSNCDPLPDGWRREKFSLNKWKVRAAKVGSHFQLPPKSLREYTYFHVSEPDYFFWYPVPVLPRAEGREQLDQMQYLYCKTSRAFLDQKPGRTRHTALWDDNGCIGTMIYGLDVELKEEPKKLELVAVVKGWVTRTSVSYELMRWARNDKDLKWWKDQEALKLDCYFVLSIEWDKGVAYRTAVGWVIAEEWDKNAEPVELILG